MYRSIAIITPGHDREIIINLSEDRLDILIELCEIAGWDYELDPEDA